MNEVEVEEFLRTIFSDNTGYLMLVAIKNGTREQLYYDYPRDLNTAINKIKQWYSKPGYNVYYKPVLLHEPNADSVTERKTVTCADLDILPPTLVSPKPSIIVESSPGRYQSYWFGTGVEPTSVNGTIVTNHDLKRLPNTKNWKYSNSEPWMVKLIDPSTIDNHERVIVRRGLDSLKFVQLLSNETTGALANLAGYCARLGCTVNETFLVLVASKASLNVDLSRIYKIAATAVQANGLPSLLTESEVRNLDGLAYKDSFVDAYVSWAKQCTDSPEQYHVAGALTILSSLLSPHIRLPASFGEFRCNLWFMILAGTTLTRKTTATELAINLVRCILPDAVATTNGNSEGLLSALSARDGESSIFHRDEISGFLKEVSKKYMTGILETLTRLYDGGTERRTLRSQTIEIRDPHLIMLCGGIKSKTIDLLDTEHIESGFIPRFLMVTGKTEVEDMKPIGPPTEGVKNLRDDLVKYLDGLLRMYESSSTRGPLLMSATDEAWERIRQLERDVHEIGLGSDNPDIFCPLYERCMNSIVKVSVLLAADRAYREGAIAQLDVRDVITAISYAARWLEAMHEVAGGIEDKPSKDEVRLARIERAIRGAAEGIGRSEIMRRFRLSAREANDIEATLIGRNLVKVSSLGRATVYRSPSNIERSI